MTSLQLAEIAQKLKEEGKAQAETLPDGHYSFQILRAFVKPVKDKDTINANYLCKVVGGPDDGKTTFFGNNIGPGNRTGTGIWMQHLDSLGLDSTWYLAAGTTIEQIGEALIGRAFEADVTTQVTDSGGRFQRFRSVRTISVNGQAPAPAPAPPVAVAPVAAPVPVAAAVVPSPATAAAPVDVPVVPNDEPASAENPPF